MFYSQINCKSWPVCCLGDGTRRLSVTDPANFLDGVPASSYTLRLRSACSRRQTLATLSCAVMKGKDIGLPHLRAVHFTSATGRQGS